MPLSGVVEHYLYEFLDLVAHHVEVPIAFAVGSLILGGVAWWLAPRRGWAQVPAALAGCGLALALAVTVVRPIGHFAAGGLNPLVVIHECVFGSLSLAHTYEKLNVAMLMPFAFFATRRPVIVAVSCLLISGSVEFVQGATGGGTCQARDVVHNTAGGVLGVLLALVAAVALGLHGRRSRVTADVGAGPQH
jgi:hypothetical protein